MAESSHEVTRLLSAIAGGDSRASEELLPLVYDELRRLAHARMAQEPSNHTLQPTALVHEAYLRLIASGGVEVKWDSRGHFFAAAAEAMRRILIERARRVAGPKRGGGWRRRSLDDAADIATAPEEELLVLDEALERFERHDQRKFQVVMLRYFAGLSVEHTASALGVSETTVKADWAYARAWLHRAVSAESGPA